MITLYLTTEKIILMKLKLQPTLHYRNRGQMIEIEVDFFKNRQGKKRRRRKLAIFCPASMNFVDCREI